MSMCNRYVKDIVWFIYSYEVKTTLLTFINTHLDYIPAFETMSGTSLIRHTVDTMGTQSSIFYNQSGPLIIIKI